MFNGSDDYLAFGLSFSWFATVGRRHVEPIHKSWVSGVVLRTSSICPHVLKQIPFKVFIDTSK